MSARLDRRPEPAYTLDRRGPPQGSPPEWPSAGAAGGICGGAFLISSVAGRPLELRVVAEGQEEEIGPLLESAWRQGQATGEAAIDYRWHPVRVPMPMTVCFPDWRGPPGR